MLAQQPLVADLASAVRSVFSNRPTLRQVAAKQLMNVIIRRYPLIAVHRPTLVSAETLYLMRPHPDGKGWTSQLLVDVVLKAMLDATLLDLSDVEGLDYRFSLAPPHRFYAIEASNQTADGDVIRPHELEADFNQLLPLLHEHFCDAQARYWNGAAANFDRGLWLQQILRLSLFEGLRNEALDEDQRGCLHDLLLGRTDGFAIQFVQVQLQAGGRQYREILPNLLVTASNEVRTLQLWCSSAGEVRGFDSQAAFASALQAQMSLRYRFDTFAWILLDSEGDAFAMQAAVLLEDLLQRVGRVRRSLARNVDELEAMYAQACEPSIHFVPYRQPTRTASSVKLPRGLTRAAMDDQTAYAQAMLDLAVLQTLSGGDYALEGVDDLQTYAARRLREEMLGDHPIDANYFADDLLLQVDTFANDGHGLGFAQKTGSKTLTLTEFAIGRLDATGAGVVTAIRHRENQLIMGWMNIDYVRKLVDRVDVGGTYPLYVNARMDDVGRREQRLTRFSEQWRLTLRFDAVRARINKIIDLEAYQALIGFCRTGKASLKIAPLAFKRSPTSQVMDPVFGMYVLEFIEPSVVLLYCPLYPDRLPLRQFTDHSTLLAAIRKPGKLQDAVLMWMEQSQRAIYDNGGFNEPHLPNWVFDPYSPMQKPAPVSLSLQWRSLDLNTYLFDARRKLMIEIADRTAMSNSEQRWAVIKAFSWELLNVAMPVLPGPIASVAWLYAGVRGLTDDVDGLSAGDTPTVIEAVVDILNNTLMALIHLQLPSSQPRAIRAVTTHGWLDTLPAGDGASMSPGAAPEPLRTQPITALQPGVDSTLDFSWSGGNGSGSLYPEVSERLRALRSEVSLTLRSPVAAGRAAGLYQVNGRYYIPLGYGSLDVYEVRFDQEGAFISGADGTYGPSLVNANGKWRLDLRLAGGSGRGQGRERIRQKIAARVTEGMAKVDRYLESAQRGTNTYLALGKEIGALQGTLAKLDVQLNQPRPVEPEKLQPHERLHQLYLQKQQEVTAQKRLKQGERLEVVDKVYHDYLDAETYVATAFDSPGFVRNDRRTEAIRTLLDSVRQNLIGFGLFIIDETLELIDISGYQALVDQMNTLPVDLRPELYRRYITLLEGIVVRQPTIIEVSRQMDRLLAVTDAGLQISYGNEPLTVEQVIATRRTSTVAISFFQAMNLAELGLKFQGKSNVRLHSFRQVLASERLRVAANTHHLSLHSDLPVTVRIEILQSAWDEYVAAILNSDRLKSLGDKLIDTQRLEAYKEQMIALRTLAADALVDAMREQAAGQALAPRRAVYPRKVLQVAHTHGGQIVMGAEAVIDGKPVLHVKGAFSNEISHVFHRQDGAWVEEVPAINVASEAREASPEIDAKAAAFARGLLDNNDQVIQRAEAMVREDADDRGLADLLDGQVNDLTDFAGQLPEGEEAGQLRQRMRDAIARVRGEKVKLLTELYTRTRYPKAQGLAFLHEHGAITVEYVGPRREDAEGYLDEYRISLKGDQGKKGKPLWAAHFHFADAQAAATAFGKGHLKLWSQRLQGYKHQMIAADAGQVLRIYRGNLTYAQARGIIPFNEFG